MRRRRGRWYVLRDGRPVTWEEAVVNGAVAADIYAVTWEAGAERPWRVLWAPAGTVLTGEAVAWAQSGTTPGPVPPLPETTTPPLPIPGQRRAAAGVGG